MNILRELRARFAQALDDLTGGQPAGSSGPAELVEMVRQSQDAKFGDYQANMAMPLGKQLGRPPRDVASAIVAELDVGDLCQPPEIAGPGFINLRCSTIGWPAACGQAVDDPRLGIRPVDRAANRRRSITRPPTSPSRCTSATSARRVIGDSIYRTLKFLGHRVISDNHIGDWGTQFGMIIYGYRNFSTSRHTAVSRSTNWPVCTGW